MPTYRYRCERCKHEFEEIRNIKQPGPPCCPNCYKLDPPQIYSKPTIIFKGAGWTPRGRKR